MSRTEILEKLKEILLSIDDQNEHIAECTEDAHLRTYFGMSSVNLLYMVIAIEETFDIRFENVGMASFDTIRDVIDYIAAKL